MDDLTAQRDQRPLFTHSLGGNNRDRRVGAVVHNLRARSDEAAIKFPVNLQRLAKLGALFRAVLTIG
jgi:hypothetical protein